jgi:hypothetical protein
LYQEFQDPETIDAGTPNCYDDVEQRFITRYFGVRVLDPTGAGSRPQTVSTSPPSPSQTQDSR